MRATVCTCPQDLERELVAWDELAIAAGKPFCSPAWMLAWWGEGRCGDARLRVVLVHEGDELIGVGPFFAQVGPLKLAEYRLLGAGFCHRIGPVARPGREDEAGTAMARALAAAEPPVASVVFEGIERDEPWPERLAAGWPGRRPRLRTDLVMEAPEIALEGGYESWLAQRERKFRKEARRTARRLAEEGVTARVALDDEAIDALLQLHHARWQERGGSNVGAEARAVVLAAAERMRALGDETRIAVALLEGPDGPVAAELTVRAGDRIVFWSGGFDPAWAKLAPGTQALLTALETAAAEGVAIADLGGGDHDYKRKLADGSRPIAWRTLFPLGPRYPLIRLRLLRKHLRLELRRAALRLPEERQQQLRALMRRARRRG